MNGFTIKPTHSSIQPQDKPKNTEETTEETTEEMSDLQPITDIVSDTKNISYGGMAIRATSTLHIDSF
jgi:hypothetical protein